MEFEKDPTITDEQRILAATKTVTIQPISANIILEETAEPVTINERQPNLERDSEDTAARNTLLQPSKGENHQQIRLQSNGSRFLAVMIVVAVAVGLIVVVALFVSRT